MAKFIELLLTALQYQAEGLLEIADILLSTPQETRRWFHRMPTYERHWFKKNWAEVYRDRQQFYKMLNHLKRQGLVARKGKEIKSPWFLTKLGKEKVQDYRNRRKDPFSPSSIDFEQPRGNGVTIVAFDVPEKERKKRDWIRLCLTDMGFRRLQRSVWVAPGQVQEDFMNALRRRNLSGYVHIFAVTKQGTLRIPGS